MNTLVSGQHTFEIVEEIPYGYVVWNIGKNMKSGYLPLVQVGGWDGYQVIGTMKALPLKDAQKILSVTTHGQSTINTMESYIRKHKSADPHTNENHYEKVVAALKILRTIPGAEKLDEYEEALKFMRQS